MCKRYSTLRQKGFTLVELLVVMSIIGILIALLMPAVQSSRESARRTQCSNNLKQLGLAALSSLQAHGWFPTGGWGGDWVCDPTRGYGKEQPGGWIYNLLPFIDQQQLHDIGVRGDPNNRKQLNFPITQAPLPLFICPTRRRATLYPFARRNFYNLDYPDNCLCSKSCYAANAGSTGNCERSGLATSLAQGDAKTDWPAPSTWNGVSFLHSQVTPEQVTDGLSNTILFGEKYLDAGHYTTGDVSCDNHTIMIGFDNDTYRSSNQPPVQDRPGLSSTTLFGGPHVGGCNFVFCDGSVSVVSFSVDPTTFLYLGSRNDNRAVDRSKL